MESQPSSSKRMWGWVAVGIGLPALLLVGAAAWASWFTEGPAAGAAMAAGSALLLSPWGVVLIVGLWMVVTGTLSPIADAPASRPPRRTVYNLTVGMLFLQALVWVGTTPLCGCSTRVKAYEAAMKSDLKNLASQQEIYHSDEQAYSASPAALAFTHSDGVDVEIVASDVGWAARATHAALGIEGNHCVIHYGDAEPIPLHGGEAAPAPGVVLCKEEAPAERLSRLPPPVGPFLAAYHRQLTRRVGP